MDSFLSGLFYFCSKNELNLYLDNDYGKAYKERKI